jgi:hypothetical protein
MAAVAALTPPIPTGLAPLMQLNTEYKVLLCLGHGCCYTVSPAGFSRHLRRKHQTQLELQEQVNQYVTGFLCRYNYATVALPLNRLPPQPVIPIGDRFQCRHCPGPPLKTQSWKVMKAHRNKDYSKKRAADKDLFDQVRLQTWFRERKERFWVVDESQPPPPQQQLGQGARPARPASAASLFDRLRDRDREEGSKDKKRDEGEGEEKAAVKDQIA